MVFDIKSDTLARKAGFVAGGHKTNPLNDSMYSSVVSRDMVRLFFLIVVLNDVNILACDVQNAYINAETKEKVLFKGGEETGQHKDKMIVIVHALYGLKSPSVHWREHMVQTLCNAGFAACKADPDLWLRPAMKPDGTEFYEYILYCVDDCCYSGLEGLEFMGYLASVYALKEGSVKVPKTYLGTDIRMYELTNGEKAWAASSDMYVKRAVAEVKRKRAFLH
jgi:hypothetical protein